MEPPVHPISFDDELTPYSIIPTVYPTSQKEKLASDWPEHLCQFVYRLRQFLFKFCFLCLCYFLYQPLTGMGWTPIQTDWHADIPICDSIWFSKKILLIKDFTFIKPSRSADKLSDDMFSIKVQFWDDVWIYQCNNTVKLIWETVPHSRSSGAKAAVSELGSCAWLHLGSCVCVGGSKSRTTAGLCNCLNTVRQVLWRPVGVHEVHYEAQFICDPVLDRQPVTDWPSDPLT